MPPFQIITSSASIVPPPFGSGYLPSWHNTLPYSTLQLCRPLSGAVMSAKHTSPVIRQIASIVPPPFGSGYGDPPMTPQNYWPLQLCRPLSGAVISWGIITHRPVQMLQLCRPLSGAVITACAVLANAFPYASIVPPPFGSGYSSRLLYPPDCSSDALQLCRPLSGAVIPVHGQGDEQGQCASIVPPPFGSGYVYHPRNSISLTFKLQLCRPLSGAVICRRLRFTG